MKSRNFRTIGGLWHLLLLGAFALAGSFVFAQDYTIEEYNEYQKAVEEGEDAIIAFIKAHPESSLKEYAVGAYLQRLQGYIEQGQHEKVVSAGEKFLQEVDPERFEVLYMVAWSAFYSQQFEKAAEYGAKAYQIKPDAPQLEPILARSYLSIGKTEQAVAFAEKFCNNLEPKECYDLLPVMTRHYAARKSWEKAAEYARKTIQALDSAEKPQGVADAEWKKFVNEEKSAAYAILGRLAFERKQWNNAEKHYATALKLNPANKMLAAESNYYIGMARWSMEQIDPAMVAFARCTVLEGTPHAEPCRKQLETLYRATHNGSLAGLDEFLERAQRSNSE
ncbi:MAG: hypothetical protein Kow00109_26900 [Acidobacteriota bacterium]